MPFVTLGRWLACAAALAGSLGFASQALHSASLARSTESCRGPDEISDLYIWNLRHDAAQTDSDTVADWEAAGFLPVTASDITLVTDSTICLSVLAGYNAAAAQETPGISPVDSLYVVRVGPRYDAFDPAVGDGEFVTHRIFDTSFVHLKTYVR